MQKHLIEIDKTANNRVNDIIKQFVEKECITEELKAQNQLELVGQMNLIKNCAEEIIYNKLIYV